MAQSEKKIRNVWKCEWEEHEEFHDDDGKHISEELFPPTIYYSQRDERRRGGGGELTRGLEEGSHIYR